MKARGSSNSEAHRMLGHRKATLLKYAHADKRIGPALPLLQPTDEQAYGPYDLLLFHSPLGMLSAYRFPQLK
ncbi:MAG: hypothetical protein AAF587_27495 [Bacteroidota bacterium]